MSWNGNKNDNNGCGTAIAVMLILGLLVEFLPIAFGIAIISLIIAGLYKYFSRKKKVDNNYDEKEENKNDSEENEEKNLTENELKDIVYKKNKLISEQNFEMSEKSRKIEKLEKELEKEKSKNKKLLSEKNFKKEYIKMEDLDGYTWETALLVSQIEKCNTSMIQKRLKIGFNRACKIIDELYKIGIVGQDTGDGFRKVLVDKYGITEIYSKLVGGTLEKKHQSNQQIKDAEIEKLNNQIVELKNTILVKDSVANDLERIIENLKNEIGKIDEEHSERKLRLEHEFQREYSGYEEEKNKIRSEIMDIKTELKIINDKAIKTYYCFSDYSNSTSQECLNKLSILKTKESELRKSDEDVDIFDYSEKKKFIERSIRQILRNFNSECDNIITNIKVKNIDSVRDKIRKSYETLNNLYSKDGISLTDDILSLKLEQATLLYTYELKRIEEKEIQQAIKEQMIEEAKAEREIEQQKKKVEKDLHQHLGEVNRLMKYMQKTQIDAERQLYIEKIKELEDKIKNLEADKEAVLDREANAKAGFVYIISNIGSFGENIYKIGMTRRLEPMDRVKELSSASVPFEFDVHAMIFSSDAPELENMLHKHFADNAVNKVNPRKEFYKVDIDDIERVVKENYNDTVKFTKIPVAAEYRQSINLGMSVD